MKISKICILPLKSILIRQTCSETKIIRRLSGINVWKEELSSSLKCKIEEHWSPKLIYNQYNDKAREKYYVLSMFPYPSGNLHMGHVRVYTISDTIARYQRMNNKNVIHPIGWDAFGLPAENAAIERNIAPKDWTEQNIAHMKVQLQQLGCSFDWQRELSTCDPTYYKWTQELFLKLFSAGLAYQKEAFVNWDPVDKTVLADEQVDENGISWRSGAKVERKLLKQWFIKTTRFAKSLYDGLDDPVLQDWRDITKIQKHWIGECNGVVLNFPLSGNENYNFLTLWTATPQYLNDAKFIVVSKKSLLGNYDGVDIALGIKRLNISAKNPLNSQELPIFVTDQFEFLESTDTHLGIPGINENDEKFCEMVNINYALINILSDDEAQEKQKFVCDNLGGYWSSAKLRDWLLSRQRYWGTPIPIVYCKCCGVQPVPTKNLPVELPDITKANGHRIFHLSELPDWVNTTCPKCKGPAKRETDTMDTFVDSSWYYLRYLNPAETKEMFDVEKALSMMPVDVYIGGKEHATLHLYYARFISHFLHSLGLLHEREPFKRLLVQGMVMGRSFRIKGTGQYVSQDDVKIIDAKRNKAVHIKTDQPVVMSWEKMSKSKQNGVDPNDMFKEYGIDTTRLLILADVAPTSHRNWNSNTFPGIINWQKRLWLTIRDFINHREGPVPLINNEEFKKHDDFMFDSRNYYIKGVNFNYTTAYQLSVAISKMQGLTNSLRKVPPMVYANSHQYERALAAQLIMLSPMAPHFASELWSGFVSAPNRLNTTNDEILWNKSVQDQQWPEVDFDYKLDLICQVNGIESTIIKIPRCEIEKFTKDEAFSIALNQEPTQKLLQQFSIVGCSYTMYKGFEGVINIHTSRSTSREASVC